MTVSTLEEAKQFLRENWEQGTECPCCKQFVKLYRRKLNSGQAHALVILYKYFELNENTDWVHVSKFDYPAFRGGDLAKLRYWNLIEAKTNIDPTKKDSGFWRLTDTGRAFVRGDITVESHIGVYNQTIYTVEAQPITIRQALGNKFNYNELMEA